VWWATIVAVPALLMAGVAPVWAQAAALSPNCSGTIYFGGYSASNIGSLGASAGAISSTLSGVIGSVNTAFLSQQGSAFVSAPGNAAPEQAGAGVWTRALAGEVTTRSTTSNNGVGEGGIAGEWMNTRCRNSVQQYYSGMQVGTDLSRLNINGWNVHVGATAGYLGSTASDDGPGNGGLRTAVDVPFLGAYVAATRGSFFADLMVRGDFYNLSLQSPNLGILNRPVGARGISISASAGYNIALPNNYFIEPSAGFIWSNTSVDAFHSTVPPGLGGDINMLGGTTTTDDVASRLGRLSVRAGTSIATSNVIYQPFVTASIFHEFAGDVRSAFSFCPGCVKSTVSGEDPQLAGYSQASATTRVGTYSQFSAGLAAQIVNTGWLGFVRADYRTGGNIEGYAGNVGLRYQFAPDAARPLLAFKAPFSGRTARDTTDWSGFYIGGYAGAAAGKADITFAAAPALGNTSPTTTGALAGLQAGYNHQINNWVLGVEGEFGLARLDGARPCGSATDFTGGFDPFFQTCEDRMNWSGTFAGRLGYATGRSLFYAKAGVAWADGRVNVNCIDGSAINTISPTDCHDPKGNHYPNSISPKYATADGYGTSAAYDRLGWMVGLGTEFDLGRNWSAKAEYDYIRFGSQTATAADGETRLTSRNALNQVKIGLNYRLGGDGSAVDGAPLFTKSAALTRVHDWSGFYIGGNVGAGIASTGYARLVPDWTTDGLAGFGEDGSHPANGLTAGGQAGYRAQSGRVVFGVEAQGDWASLRGSNASRLGVGYYEPSASGSHYESRTNETRVDSVGVFTGQLGYTFSDALLYLKGGAVAAHERSNLFDNSGDYYYWGLQTGFHPNVTSLAGSMSDTRWGAAVGAGAEYAFSANWSAGIDYVHGFLGTVTYSVPSVTPDGSSETLRIRQSLDMLSLRVNYRFGTDGSAAKY